MCPQQMVPVVKDGDLAINESRAGAAYLVNAYGKDDKLYPKDPKVRAVVDQRMYFDMGTFYKAMADVLVCQVV
jgi:glutathione S-transferase